MPRIVSREAQRKRSTTEHHLRQLAGYPLHRVSSAADNGEGPEFERAPGVIGASRESGVDGSRSCGIGLPSVVGERVDELGTGCSVGKRLLGRQRHLLHQAEGVVEAQHAGGGQGGVPAG